MDLDRLAAAKLWLVSEPRTPGSDAPRDLPYLAHALYAMVPVECADVQALTVDQRWRIYVNAAWLAATPVPDVGRRLAHLVWHLLADHATRARDLRVTTRTADHWGRAADVTIHALLAPERLADDELAGAAALLLPEGLATEEYYALLSRLPPDVPTGVGTLPADHGCGSGADGIPRSHELPPDDLSVDPGEAGEIRRRVAAEHLAHAQRRGDRPGEATRWARTILEPTVAWEPLLDRAVRNAVGWAAGRGEPTYTRPSRRRSPGVVLPGQRRPAPRVAMVVDTSGSVDDLLLGRALGEVDGALRALGVSAASVTVYAVDAAVHAVRTVRRARDVALAGGGGTDMRRGITAATGARPRPDVLVVFTDGETPWPSAPPPGTEVVVAVLGRKGVPLPASPRWAARVECLL